MKGKKNFMLLVGLLFALSVWRRRCIMKIRMAGLCLQLRVLHILQNCPFAAPNMNFLINPGLPTRIQPG